VDELGGLVFSHEGKRETYALADGVGRLSRAAADAVLAGDDVDIAFAVSRLERRIERLHHGVDDFKADIRQAEGIAAAARDHNALAQRLGEAEGSNTER